MEVPSSILDASNKNGNSSASNQVSYKASERRRTKEIYEAVQMSENCIHKVRV